MPAAKRRKVAPDLGPADVQRLGKDEERAGVVELHWRDRVLPGLAEAVAEVADRYPEALWAGRLDVSLFPKMVREFLERTGMPETDFYGALPAVGLVRGGELYQVAAIRPLFQRGEARLRSLAQQVDAFAYKMAVTYRPRPKAQETTVPRYQVNREKQVAVRVTRGGATRDLELYELENLLDGVLERGMELDYSCKQGKCDTCKVRVLKGAENLTEPSEGERQVLGEEGLAEGYRLSCQAHVKGPVEIVQ